jgi:hypothetical protein
MIYVLYVIGALVALLIGFIIWRWTSVMRGARQRDERILRLLDPIGQKFEAGQAVSQEEVREIAARYPETRLMMFGALTEIDHSELIPTDFDSSIEQAKNALIYWMMHPNELQDPPAAIEFVETVSRPIAGKARDFHVFRYRMAAGHWAAKDGWLLGFAGPMEDEAPPYSYLPGAFSRCNDQDGKIVPTEIVDWYIGMLKAKGATSV